jgi:hypothetical protein
MIDIEAYASSLLGQDRHNEMVFATHTPDAQWRDYCDASKRELEAATCDECLYCDRCPRDKTIAYCTHQEILEWIYRAEESPCDKEMFSWR